MFHGLEEEENHAEHEDEHEDAEDDADVADDEAGGGEAFAGLGNHASADLLFGFVAADDGGDGEDDADAVEKDAEEADDGEDEADGGEELATTGWGATMREPLSATMSSGTWLIGVQFSMPSFQTRELEVMCPARRRALISPSSTGPWRWLL